MGLHTSGPATNGTSIMAEPASPALRFAVKLVPEALLEISATTLVFEIVGGPGHVPPDMASPPVSTMVEPTVTQNGVG